MLHNPAFNKIVRRMFFTLRNKGVGLAAPQVGQSLQFAVIEIRKTKLRPHVVPLEQTVVINPKITKRSKKRKYDWEGCLSFSGVRGLVPRHETITIRYTDMVGKNQTIKLKGFQARVFQHEIDHLHGVLYIDRMSDMSSLMTLSEFKKRILKNGLKSK